MADGIVPLRLTVCLAVPAADPSLSEDTDSLAEAQSGAAPTAEGENKELFELLPVKLTI